MNNTNLLEICCAQHIKLCDRRYAQAPGEWLAFIWCLPQAQFDYGSLVLRSVRDQAPCATHRPYDSLNKLWLNH